MEELKARISKLEEAIESKSKELVALREELTLVKARFEDLRQKQEQADREARLAEEMEQKRREEEKARRKEEELRKEQEEEAVQAHTKESEPVEHHFEAEDEVSESEPEIAQIGKAEHEAILRTIAELSKTVGAEHANDLSHQFEGRATLGDKVSRQKINDIKRSIGINERFLYANELFGGDMSAFSQAVDELNHVASVNDANRLIEENLAPKYRWDEESETVQAFRALVDRRFA